MLAALAAVLLVETIGVLPQKHAAEITAVAFSADGRWIVTGGGDRKVKLWEARSGKELATFGPVKGTPRAVATDGERVIAATGAGVQTWPVAGGAPDEQRGKFVLCGMRVATEPCDAPPVPLAGLGKPIATAASADGARVAAIDAERRLTVVDLVRHRRIVDGVVAARRELTAVALSPDGAMAVTASRDTSFERWDLATGRRLPRGAGVPVRALAFDRHGRPVAHPLAVAATHGALTVRGDHDGVRLEHGARRLLFERTRRGVAAVAFSRDGRRAAAVDDAGQLTLIDVRARSVVARVAAHDGPALAVAFGDEGGVVTGGDDHCVRVWDSTGKRVAQLELGSAVTAVAAAGDRVVAAERGGWLHVWDGRSPRAAAVDLRASDDWAESVALAPDGKRFAAGTHRGVIRVYED